MIEEKNNTKRITCDKCGHSSCFSAENADKLFYMEGWQVNSNAKKYKHRCYYCLTPKEQKTWQQMKKFI